MSAAKVQRGGIRPNCVEATALGYLQNEKCPSESDLSEPHIRKDKCLHSALSKR